MFRQWRWFPAALLAGTIMLSGSVTAQAVTIRIKAAFATDSPYQFVDACRRPVGMHIDILDAIAKECDLVVEYLPLATNTECLDALENGQADIILGVISPNGAGNNRTTGEISSSPVCMIVPNRILSSEGGIELKGYTAVYQYGTIDSYLISSLGFSRYIISGSQGELMDTHLSGRAAAIVGCKNSILYQLRQRGLQEDYTILHNDMATVSYAIAVPDQDYSLLYLLNNGIASLRASREYEEILNRWIISDYSEDMKRLLRVGITAFGLLGIATLAYIFINNRIRGILKRQVEEKTKEVTEANHALEKRVIQLENESDLRNRMIKYSPIGMVLFDRNFRVNLANRGGLPLDREKWRSCWPKCVGVAGSGRDFETNRRAGF